MKQVFSIVLFCFILVSCKTSEPKNDIDVSAIQTSAAKTVIAGNPSQTPITPTITPIPASTETPTPEPQPITLTGTGDAVIDFINPFSFSMVHITGNSNSRYFGIIAHGQNNYIETLVNTTDPYDGYRILSELTDNVISRFEIKSNDNWTIEVMPLSKARRLTIPGNIEGRGDDIIVLDGVNPDLVKIRGNSESRYFGVFGYGKFKDILVNTTDPYDGTVLINPDTEIIEITSSGNWVMQITGK